MGGGFIYALACKHSEIISAISVVAGLMNSDTYNNCNMQPPVSLAIFHGTNDTIHPIEGIPPTFYQLMKLYRTGKLKLRYHHYL